MQTKNPSGIKSSLTNYGDPEFSVYIRKAFAKAMGYSDQELERPIIGIILDYNSPFYTLLSVVNARYKDIMQTKNPSGIKSSLTNYGDPEFSVYIRKAFAKAMGYSDQELERPIIHHQHLQRFQ